MSHELYHKHRPKSLKQVVGQDSAVKVLEKFIRGNDLPHALLFTGPSGVGKTTLARILKKHLDCSDGDFREMNCASFRGIDTVRDIIQQVPYAPVGGRSRIWLIDEAHGLSRDAMEASLKLFEDTPPHCYFFLATTNPAKLLPTIVSRCTEVKLRKLPPQCVDALVKSVAEKEGMEVGEEVRELIVECADGGARKALVLLNALVGVTDADEQRQAIYRTDSRKQAIDLARLLMNPRGTWDAARLILKDLEDDAEGVRRLILAYATSVLLGGGKIAGRAADVINRFEDNFFDGGKASLCLACYEILAGK